jgi:predicted dehydrogenase
MDNRVAVALIGCGLIARHHMRMMLQQTGSTHIAVLCDPDPEAYALAAQLFREAGAQPPPYQPDFDRCLRDYRLDAAFIMTPHVWHHDQTRACLEAGLDVLLEKPMVMNASEACSLIETRDRTGRLLVVAFPGSLSPQIRTAARLLHSGVLGRVLTISALVWQNWGSFSANTWRQQPEVSGGGFLFDTGAHMLNTVVDLAGEDFWEVAAWSDNFNRPVDTLSVVIGRLASGALVTLHACGESIPACASDLRVFTDRAILRTGIWGERLELQRAGRKQLRPIPMPPSLGVWEQFLAVRNGQSPNPCPPEIGLRMARLYDAIQASAAQGGSPVRCD